MILASGMSEAEAIEGAKQSDSECFEFLYKLHKRRVYSLCLRMIRDVESAEDLAQEAFLQLFRNIHKFRGESAFSTWLHRLTVNVVLMRLRKRILPEVSLEETLGAIEDGGSRKDFGCKDQILFGSIDRLVLERAIENLPPGYRIIFVLHDVEGYEHNEIAEMLGCCIGTSKSQLHKARMSLRDQLNVTRAENSRRPEPRKMKIHREVTVASEREQELETCAAVMAANKTHDLRRISADAEKNADEAVAAERLLKDMELIMSGRQNMATAELIPALRALPTGGWSNYRRPGGITNDRSGNMLLSNLLQRLGVSSGTIRVAPKDTPHNTLQGYKTVDVLAAMVQYEIDPHPAKSSPHHPVTTELDSPVAQGLAPIALALRFSGLPARSSLILGKGQGLKAPASAA
jgi:RNA polymerase sigma-70 factor (ECF subfamily)